MSARTPIIRCCLDVHPPRSLLPKGVNELAADASLFWPNGSAIRVAFADGPPSMQSNWFAVASQWSQNANIDFVPTSNSSYDILVSFGGQWGVYYSYLGTAARSIPRGTPTMVLGGLDQATTDEFQRVVIHEAGHSLGCIHEHQSPAAGIPWKVQAVYDWYAKLGWGKEEVDQQVFGHYQGTQTQFTAWDRDSVMEYPIDDDLVLDPTFAVGWNRVLSPTDRAFIAQLYPGRMVPKPPPPPPPIEKPVDPDPVNPPPSNVTDLDFGADPVLGQAAVGQTMRYTLKVRQATTARIQTLGACRTTVAVGRLRPQAKVIARGAGGGPGGNGKVTVWLERGNYVVDVLVRKSAFNPGQFFIVAEAIGRSLRR